MKTHAKDFAGVGGLYSAHLLLGHFGKSTPMRWHWADLDLAIGTGSAPQESQQQLPKSQRINYKPLPPIEHQFRQAEPRPPAIVSGAFALMCAAPMLLLFVLWLRIGLNFGNLKVSIWALGFFFFLNLKISFCRFPRGVGCHFWPLRLLLAPLEHVSNVVVSCTTWSAHFLLRESPFAQLQCSATKEVKNKKHY